MEARTQFRGSSVSPRMLLVIAAVLVAFILGAGGGYITKALSVSSTPSTYHSVPGGTVDGPAPRPQGGRPVAI